MRCAIPSRAGGRHRRSRRSSATSSTSSPGTSSAPSSPAAICSMRNSTPAVRSWCATRATARRRGRASTISWTGSWPISRFQTLAENSGSAVASAALTLDTIPHELSALHGGEHPEAPPGFRLAPGLNPVLRVLDLHVPALCEPLFQQDPLAEHFIGFIGSRLGVPLGVPLGVSLSAGGPNGGGDKQECKSKTHGISIDRMTMQQHSSILAMPDGGERAPRQPQ